MLGVRWDRPTTTTDGGDLDPATVLTYDVYLGSSILPSNALEIVVSVSVPQVAFTDLPGYPGMYIFVRARTTSGILSGFSSGRLLGIPHPPSNLRVEDLSA